MQQPTKIQIVEKVSLILSGKNTREEVCEWASNYIRNDDIIELNDIEAWHFLVAISKIDEMIFPDIYLYSIDDIKEIMKEHQ